eukprot:287025_1
MDRSFLIIVFISFIYSLSSGNDLNSVFVSNVTLETAITYNVISNILIEEDVFFTVPNNVTIIFKDDWTIYVKGYLIMGCSSMDTFNDRHIGIISADSSILVSNANSTRKGIIEIDNAGSISLCNTKFNNLSRINVPSTNFLVDNCEFYNMDYCINFEYGPAYIHASG